ncbi:uncharacterized protein LOC120336935 isoform X1 [Styela clava]
MPFGGSPIRNKANMASDTELNLEYAASIILRVFKKYDEDGGGTLQRRELRSLLRQCGATLSSRQCDEIIDQLDTDGDGEMNFAEFMSFLGRLYQLQFFGTDPGNFWNPSPQVVPKNSKGPGARNHQQPNTPPAQSLPPNLMSRPLPVPPKKPTSYPTPPGRYHR